MWRRGEEPWRMDVCAIKGCKREAAVKLQTVVDPVCLCSIHAVGIRDRVPGQARPSGKAA